jgi:hypothetical protein
MAPYPLLLTQSRKIATTTSDSSMIQALGSNSVLSLQQQLPKHQLKAGVLVARSLESEN